MSDTLTSEQVDAVTYAYLDICATNTFLNSDDLLNRRMWARLEDADIYFDVTKVDLEKAFPWLLEEAGDE